MGILPKSTTPINQRKKSIPGVKPVELPKPIEEKIMVSPELPKSEPIIAVQRKQPPQKRAPRGEPPNKEVMEIIERGIARQDSRASLQVPSEEEAILELINRRQRQIIVHSVIYYRMNENIITDETWNTWARELVELQRRYPKIAEQSVFWNDMKDFDGSTGFHLADHIWGMKVAPSVLNYNKRLERG